jgi:hypothetical protein
MSRRTRTAQRHDGHTPHEAAQIEAQRRDAGRWLAWIAIALVVISWGRAWL